MVDAEEPRDQGSEDLKRQSVGGYLWLLSGNGVQAIIQIGVLAVLARLIPPRVFGLLAAGRIVAELGVKVGITGIGRAIIQKKELSKDYIQTAFTVACLIGVGLAALMTAGADVVAGLFDLQGLRPVVSALSLFVIARALSLVSASVLERRLEFARLKAYQITGYLVGYGAVGISLAVNGFGVWALVAAVVVEASLGGLLQFLSVRHGLVPRVDRRSLREMAEYAGGISLTSISSFVALRGDYFIVARWLGDTALGLYERSYKLIEGGLQLGGALDRVMFPALSKMQGFPERMGRAFGRSVAVMALVFMPFSAFLCVMAPELIRLLLGADWTAAIPVFQVLAFGLYLRSAYKLAGGLARAKGFVYELALRQALYAVLIVTGAIGGARWGVQGVALAVLAVLAIHYVSMSSMGMRHADIGWKAFVHLHVHGLVLCALVTVVSLMAASWLRTITTLDWAVLSATGVCNVGVVLGVINWLPRKVIGASGIWLLETLDEHFPVGAVVRWLE